MRCIGDEDSVQDVEVPSEVLMVLKKSLGPGRNPRVKHPGSRIVVGLNNMLGCNVYRNCDELV